MSTRITAFRSACIAGATLILSLVAASARGPADEPGHDGLGEWVAALMAAWGTDDVRWDLNADGIVDAKDLEMLLAPPADHADSDSLKWTMMPPVARPLRSSMVPTSMDVV